MSKQTINLGTAPTGVGGDTPRSAFTKTQSNFDELYAADALNYKKSNVLGPVGIANGVPTGAVMSYSIDTTTGDRTTKYANGQMIFDGVRQATVGVGPGAFVAPSIARPADFVGNVSSFCDLAFFTGGGTAGNQLYATRQSLTSSSNLYLGAFINMGRSPASEIPNLALGSTVAQSYLFWFVAVGRWF